MDFDGLLGGCEGVFAAPEVGEVSAEVIEA